MTMSNNIKDILEELTAISAPSGYESPIINYLKNKVSQYSNLIIDEDVLGNLIITKRGKTDETIMFVAHCDEIGFAVKYIDEQGFIRFSAIGGVDISLVKGQIVNIVHNEQIIKGIVGVRPVHLSRNEKNNKGLDISDLWIDIGAKSKEDAMNLVSIGDSITFNSQFLELNNSLVSSKALDNRVGVAILLSVISRICMLEPNKNLVFVFSVQEEIGLRGAITAGYNINPSISIVVDVTHATDCPTINRNAYGDIHLGNGPVIPIGANFSNQIQNELKLIAEKEKIQYQVESLPSYSGTDAAELQLLRGGCRSGLLSIPCRYMHSPVEVCSYYDLLCAIEIILNFCIYK